MWLSVNPAHQNLSRQPVPGSAVPTRKRGQIYTRYKGKPLSSRRCQRSLNTYVSENRCWFESFIYMISNHGDRHGKLSLQSGVWCPINTGTLHEDSATVLTSAQPFGCGKTEFSWVWFLHRRKSMIKFLIVNHHIYLVLTKGIQIYTHSILKWSTFPTWLIISINLVLANFRCKIVEWEKNFLQLKKIKQNKQLH